MPTFWKRVYEKGLHSGRLTPFWKSLTKFKMSSDVTTLAYRSQDGARFYVTYTSGLYYKCFMIINYDRNDSGQY